MHKFALDIDPFQQIPMETLPFDNVAENPGDLEGMEAHGGMVKAARYVFAELRDKNILNKAFSYFDGYTVSATGLACLQCFQLFVRQIIPIIMITVLHRHGYT